MKIYDREIKHLKYKNKILDVKRQKINKEDNSEINEIEYINPENEEEEILETDITYFPDISNNLKSKKNNKRMKINKE